MFVDAADNNSIYVICRFVRQRASVIAAVEIYIDAQRANEITSRR